jgi:hypothetical protein
MDERLVGLFPAGFSAEHLGPNDYYYWDDFWGVAGLQAAASMLQGTKEDATAKIALKEAKEFLEAIEKSLEAAQACQKVEGALPASPLRRMDPGAIGSLAVSYPLALWPREDYRVKATLEFLLAKCMFKGGFFQDMIHSGINAYLTLHMAQALLRAGDERYFQLIQDTAGLATPTGQWPEAIHPHTLGGCMGDGHHVWASAEWVLMMRSMFIREEDNDVVLGSGIPKAWLIAGKELFFGPTPTKYGILNIKITSSLNCIRVAWEGTWRFRPNTIIVKLSRGLMVSISDPEINFVEISANLSE